MHSLDEFWHRKYVEDERTGRLVPAQAGASDAHDAQGSPAGLSRRRPGTETEAGTRSTCRARRTGRWCRASGCRSSAYGVLYSWWLVGLGAVVALTGFYGWALEPSVAEE